MTASALSAYQDAFARALLAPDAACDNPLISDLTAQPGFAVYRNTVLKGCIDALQANTPAVSRLVGDEWFRAAAAVFARETLPSHPTLLDYGAGFADFLAAFPPAAELPYLADVARLDRLWSLAHVAADAPLLDPALLAALPPAEMARRRLRLHPAAHWRWSDEAPIGSIWSRSREGDGTIGELDWRGEGALQQWQEREGPDHALGDAQALEGAVGTGNRIEIERTERQQAPQRGNCVGGREEAEQKDHAARQGHVVLVQFNGRRGRRNGARRAGARGALDRLVRLVIRGRLEGRFRPCFGFRVQQSFDSFGAFFFVCHNFFL